MSPSNAKEQNQEIVLAKHPTGVPITDTFQMNDIDMPALRDNEVLIKTIYVSVDPGMRGFMDKGDDDVAGDKYALNKPITSRSVAQMIKSNGESFVIGDIQKGDTVVVSGAAGSVGSIASQIAKIKGCKVIGIAGSPKKIDYLEHELGLDKGTNYKQTDDMQTAIKEACPNGVDVFFDNVGGKLFDAVFANINRHGRITICGQIADYNTGSPPKGLRPMHTLIKNSARMEGFVVFDFSDEFDEAKKQIAEWYNEEKIIYKENLIQSFEKIPAVFIGLFIGENIGKQMVKTGNVNVS